ncbi:RNA-binding domain-containing protein [Lichtheimia hyalospora FSU 10163]|nr:RNA-binding domain-containing protein [Lichtheimia hyalospora FSU 10163]
MAVTTEQPTVDATKAAEHSTVEKELVEDNKVFVGNLPFKTTQEALITFFESAGKVTEATIIKHGRRSLGYGFVGFETAAQAEKARKELNKKELEGREVNVEVAKPKTHVDKKPETSSDNESALPRARKSRRRMPRRRNNKKKKAAAADAASEQQDQTDTSATKKEDGDANKEIKTKEVSSSSKKGDAAIGTTEDTTASTKKKNRNRRKRAAKAKRTEPSKTTVFVANLPYATTDEGLAEVFKNYKFNSAQVARMKSGRSKGYGFVELISEEEQKRALDNIKDVELEGRAIYLKIAMSERIEPEEEVAKEVVTEKKNGDNKETQKKEADKPTATDKPAEKKDVAKPVETKDAAKPAEKKDAAKPVETKDAAKPTEKKDTAKPAEKPADKPAAKSTDKPAEKKEVNGDKKATTTTEKPAAAAPAEKKKDVAAKAPEKK